MKPARDFRGPAAAISSALASVGAGALIGTGRAPLVLGPIAATLTTVIGWTYPLSGIVLSVLMGATIPLLASGIAGAVGPLSFHWTDIGLLLAVVCGVLSALRGGWRPEARLAFLAVGPLLVVLVTSALAAVLARESWQAVGVGARNFGWYLALPMFVQVLAKEEGGTARVRGLVLAVASVTSVVVIVGNLNAGLASTITEITGGRAIAIPGASGVMVRLVLPGMSLVPLALALVMFAMLHHQGMEGWRAPALILLLSVALVATFARGMWLWTTIGLGSVFLLRARAQTVFRIAAALVAFALVLVIADAFIGRTREMPQGLLALVQMRAAALTGGDANTAVRRVEDQEVVRQVKGSELTGVGLTRQIGLNMGTDERELFTVHNSFYGIYGRFGLIGIGAILWLLAILLSLGVRSVLTFEGARLVFASAAMAGIVRGVLSAWTQSDLTSKTGIIVVCLSAALLMAAAGDSSADAGALDEPEAEAA